MSEISAYKLEARSPFHFGVRGVGVEATSVVCHSDTLFSALCLMIRKLHGEEKLKALLSLFPIDGAEKMPPFRLSSAFPYAGEVLFFTRPMMGAKGLPEDAKTAKRVKKVGLVSQNIFEAILAQEHLSLEFIPANLLMGGRVWVTDCERQQLVKCLRPEIWPRYREAVTLRKKRVGVEEKLKETDDETTRAALEQERKDLATRERWLDEQVNERLRIWERSDVPRVTVDRSTSQSMVYQAGQVRFNQGCGLCFLIEWLDEKKRPLVEEALLALGDEGIGGERSAGHGQFTLLPAVPLTLRTRAESGTFLTLSLYHPTEREVKDMLDQGVGYGLVNRRGWMASPDEMARRRKMVRMLSEGSVLRAIAGQTSYGDLTDVTPEKTEEWEPPHKVYRYGLAFPVGLAPEAVEDQSKGGAP